jgi:hypothetical protein
MLRGAGPYLGDFNGDGRIDTVSQGYIGDSAQPALFVNLANPDGTYTQITSEPFGAANTPLGIQAVGDFNNDGRSDLLVSEGSAATLLILLSQGDGQFTPGPPVNGYNTDLGPILGDFNGDGNLDVLLLTYGTNPLGQLAFFPGDGQGRLGTPQLSVTQVFGPFNAADYNLDGNLDFLDNQATADFGVGPISLFLGAGNGTAYSPEPQSVFGSYPLPNSDNIITADFNGDGVPDIAFSTPNSITVLLGDGKGNYFPAGDNPVTGVGSHAYMTMTPMDIDGDGNTDLVLFVQDQAASAAMGAPVPFYMMELMGDGTGHFTVWRESPPDINNPNSYSALYIPFATAVRLLKICASATY